MLPNLKDSEKNELNKNPSILNNSNIIESKLPSKEQIESPSISKPIIQTNNESNETSAIFNSLINTPKLANIISENIQSNQETNMNNSENKTEEKNEQVLDKVQKQSMNNNDDNFIVLSDEENEESENNNENNNNINNAHESTINNFLNNKRKNPNQSDNDKNELNAKDSQKTELKENKIQNSGEENTNNLTKKKIDDKDKLNNTDSQGPNKVERKLYYIRKIASNRKYKFKGTDKLNIQFFIGKIMPNEFLPNFVFASEKYYYFPHKCRQVSQNYKGYIISFPGLRNALYNKIIKKDLQHLCTYYFKKPLRRQTSVDIQVKDEKTLNDGVFLNDGIVNFYLKIIEDEYTCEEGKSNDALIMRSFFYNFISNQQNYNLSNDFIIPDSCSYIKTKINVFDYKALIIPTCENYHWSLIIVNDIDKMKNIFSEENLKAFHDGEKFFETGVPQQVKKQGSMDYPEIFYLDSFYDISQRRMLNILKYLFYEYQKIYSIDVNMNNFLLKNYDKIECYNPDVPKQKNTYDCGIFLLMYAEIFLYNPSFFLQLVSKKYKVEQNKEINNANNLSQNNINDATNKTIINNNIINNNNNNANTGAIVNNLINNNNSNNNINNINQSDNIAKEKETSVMNQNDIVHNINPKKDEAFIEANNKVNNTDNINSDNNKDEFDIDKIDIQVEDTKVKDTDEQETKINDQSLKNAYINDERNIFSNDLNNNELEPEEKPISNWFSYELVNAQRTKIKNLINELSKIDRKKELKEKINEQNLIIKKYMEMQKEQFDEYFAKLKEKNV